MSQNPGIATNSNQTQVVSTKVSLTALQPTTAIVGATSGLVVDSNTNRKGLAIVNITGNPVSLGFGVNEAVLNSGITLTTVGSVYEMSEYDYTTSAINAIASLEGTIISIQEFV